MKLIFGLGNPEKEYSNTRHNVGKFVVNIIVCTILDGKDNGLFNVVIRKVLKPNICGNWKDEKRFSANILKIKDDTLGDVMFVKPLRFMNDAGIVLRDIIYFYKIDFCDVLVIYDDLDLKVSEFRFKKGKATKVHNGILSIYNLIGEKNFNKTTFLKIGIRDRKIPMSVKKYGLSPNKYVLEKFLKSDKREILQTVKVVIVPAVLDWLSK